MKLYLFLILLVASFPFCSKKENEPLPVRKLPPTPTVQSKPQPPVSDVQSKPLPPEQCLANEAANIVKNNYSTLFNSTLTKDIQKIVARYSSIGSYEYDRLYKEFGWVQYVSIEVIMKPNPSPENVDYNCWGNTFYLNIGTGRRNGFDIIKGVSPIDLNNFMVGSKNVFVDVPLDYFQKYNEILSQIPLPTHLSKG